MNDILMRPKECDIATCRCFKKFKGVGMIHNIAVKPKAEQDAIQHDLMASFWAYKEKRGTMSKPEIFKLIHQQFADPALQEHLIRRYEYFKAM